MSKARNDILDNPPKSEKKREEENGGLAQSAEITSNGTPNKQEGEKNNTYNSTFVGGTGGTSEIKKKPTTYAELLDELYPKPDEKQQKKKENRARANNAIAALGDGISAIANIIATNHGAPNMYDGKNTLTAQTQARYEKLLKDYEENLEKYRQGQLKAAQLDDERNDRERQWQRLLNLDEYKKERDEVADEHWDKDYTYRETRDNANDEFRNKQFNQNQENWNKTFDLQQQTQKDNKELRQSQIDAQNKRTEAARAKVVRGKETVFSDGSGNNVAIYDNVWKGSKQSIINALSEDPQFEKDNTLRRIKHGMAKNNEIDNFINQNWYKSDKAKAIMLALSQLDPATMTSEINGEDSSNELNWGSNNNQDLDW